MREFQAVLDTRALELASGVEARTSRHEDECAERYREIDRKLDRLTEVVERSREASRHQIEQSRQEREESSRQIYVMLWRGMSFLVVLLFGIIGYLLDKGGLPLHHP